MNAECADLIILIPSYNEWSALELLLARLETVEFTADWRISLLIVDDGSAQPLPDGWPNLSKTSRKPLEILHLRCNLGHQRAIAIGLYHIHEFTTAAAVVVMDGDGEDRVEDLPALLEDFERGKRREAVFAARGKRMESLMFQFCYQSYRIIHRILTGVEVRVGNFSVLPREAVIRLMPVSDLWNHYAAAVLRARLPRRLLSLPRGSRLAGKSKMNFVSLLTHGLNAISVFSDLVSARCLTAAAIVSLLTIVVGALSLIGWGMAGAATPGWLPFTVGALVVLSFQSLGLAAIFVFIVSNRRSAPGFILQRDSPYYILGLTSLRESAQLGNLGRSLDQWGRVAVQPNSTVKS
jgi:hypothetical protein